MKQVKMTLTTDKMLNEISKKRKGNDELVNTKQSIVAELIASAYKKEVKK